MSATPPERWSAMAVVSSAIVVLAVAGGALLLLADRGGMPAAPPATVPPSASPTATAPAPTPTPTPTPAPTPTASPAPRSTGSTISDLPALIPEQVRAFTLERSRRAARFEDDFGARHARRLYYAHDSGRVVRHLAGVFAGDRAAGVALRRQRDHVLTRGGSRVVGDMGLEDAQGVRQGRLIEVRTRRGELIMCWRNRNLVAVLGPDRPRLVRRLYDAWPY